MAAPLSSYRRYRS